MNVKQREWLAWGIVAVVLCVISIVLGVSYPVPPAPVGDIEALGTTQFANLYVVGTSDLRGNVSDGGGVFTFADNVMLDGAADAIQLLIQGYVTQTTSLAVFENSGGTDQFTVGNTGNVYAAGTFDLRGNISDGGGDFTIADNAVITGTADLQGNVSDSGGVFTFADNVMLDGAADAIQLTVQGYTTQTTSLLVLENSGGTDQFTVSNAGAVMVNGTLDVQGDVQDSGAAFTVIDNVVITGTLDVQGNLQDSGGDFYVADDTSLIGTLNVRGDISDDDSAVTVADTFVVTGTSDLQGGVTVTGTARLVSAAYTLTGTQTLNPAASMYFMTTADTLTLTLGTTGPAAGDMLIIYNTAAQNVIIVDTNLLSTTGAALTLGQYDVAMFIYNGSAWVELLLAADS